MSSLERSLLPQNLQQMPSLTLCRTEPGALLSTSPWPQASSALRTGSEIAAVRGRLAATESGTPLRLAAPQSL
eukprot:10030160-Lingulodinium_polyedra.AAC.1